MKRKIRAAADKELPGDHALFDEWSNHSPRLIYVSNNACQ
jgi:hypothetical protein